MSIGKVIRKYRKEKNMTQEEINGVIYELDERFKTAPYEECFQWAKEKLEQYPNCEGLMVSVAVVLEAQLMLQELSDTERYEDYIVSLYDRVLPSGDEALRIRAAGSLFAFYRRKKQYEKAESYLAYFSAQNPDRKIRQAEVYSGTGRTQEASGGLELATMEKDADAVVRIMRELLDALPQIGGFRDSFLYEHMNFKEPRAEFVAELRENLLQGFRDEETFGFLKGDERWEELCHTD